ncbi:hypothetical protein DASC09_054050 [Saccharomycopsis crataegensis]|uniref:F-box domain-containing protein n=1 Tax=Saccharomycopsis crataegensis TaxID=43959 RepID=A0AAV5QT29_9ASCO|nr:hypothetical protein DASC09_054050 [Saccharomycopsis crataegensis]
MGITCLPIELETRILQLAPELRSANTHYLSLYNDTFRQRLFGEYGAAIGKVLVASHLEIRNYIKGFDCIRYHSRNAVARALGLVDGCEIAGVDDLFASQHIQDSWELIYYLIKYRKIFFHKKDFIIQQSDKYHFDDQQNAMSIVWSNSLKFSKMVYLGSSPGMYNLSIGLMLESPAYGLGTTKFSVEVYDDEEDSSKFHAHDFYTASIIDDLVQKNSFFVLNLGRFPVHQKVSHQHPTKVRLVMDETGLNVKAGLKFFYVDLKPPSIYLQDQYIFWELTTPAAQKSKLQYQDFVNVLEKQASMKINDSIDRIFENTYNTEFSILQPPEESRATSDSRSNHELQQITEHFCVYSKSNEISRKIKFVTVIGQRDFEESKDAIYSEKLELGDDRHILRWRTNWG